MKIELVLSGTYLHLGKVYQKVDSAKKRIAYTVKDSVGDHLLAQRNERDIPYFRMVKDTAPAHIAAAKRHEKGGIPTPEADLAAAAAVNAANATADAAALKVAAAAAVAKADAADAAATAATAAAPTPAPADAVVDDADVDDDDLNIDDMSDEDDAEAVAL